MRPQEDYTYCKIKLGMKYQKEKLKNFFVLEVLEKISSLIFFLLLLKKMPKNPLTWSREGKAKKSDVSYT